MLSFSFAFKQNKMKRAKINRLNSGWGDVGGSQVVLRSFVCLFHSLLFIAALLLFRYSAYTCRHVRWISNKSQLCQQMGLGSKFLSNHLCPHTLHLCSSATAKSHQQPNEQFVGPAGHEKSWQGQDVSRELS